MFLSILRNDGVWTALDGLPLVHPTTICIVAAPASGQNANELADAVRDFLLALSPNVKIVNPPPCGHDAAGFRGCPICDAPDSAQLLVLVAESGAIATAPDLAWWTGGQENRRILPVFKQDEHPEKGLPEELQIYNAAFWKDSIAEVTTTVLCAAGLTPDAHRVFISYRRLETQPLAEQIFAGLNELGFDVFLDRFAVPAAVNFQRRLHQELAEKSMVVVLESDRFGESAWTTEEIVYCKQNRLGLFALCMPDYKTKKTRHLPDVLDEWRETLAESDFKSPATLVGVPPDDFVRWDALTDAALARVLQTICHRHDEALLRRRDMLRGQMFSALDTAGALDQRIRADGLLTVKSKTNTPYAVWITTRPPELPDFHATHAGSRQPPNTVGVVVGHSALLEPEAIRRLEWLSGVCRLVFVDEGQMVAASLKIAAGAL